MSEVSGIEQKQIFDAQSSEQELEAVNALVNRHKNNSTLTQQLALDASRLLTTSKERLDKQSEAGFFKRFASAISGKTSENQLLNQIDTLQMQKIAWHYLQQLQQQNLINAQAIAVIRNNLGTMNEHIIETRDFLEQAIDKIDQRLQHVENYTSFNNWAQNIEANKRGFKSIPKILLILRLTYDFMHDHPNVVLNKSSINYLITTLEKLDVNCDNKIKLLDFISDLIEQIKIIGSIEQYRAIIQLSFDGHVMDSDFVQKNISGIGFNALYFLSDQYDRVTGLMDDDELCNSDEAREKIISKFFGNEFLGLSTKYSIRDLIYEIIGGSQLAIDVYKEVNGLTAVPEAIEQVQPDEAITLVSSLPDIKAHTFFDQSENGESKCNYLRLFALCVENSASLNKLAREFIALLAEKAGYPEICQEVFSLAGNSHKYDECLPIMQTLLDDDDKKYTWLFDAFYILKLCEKNIENRQIQKIIDILKPTHLKECLSGMKIIIDENDESRILDAAEKMIRHTNGWNNIIRYRQLRFDKYYAEMQKQLNSAMFEVITKSNVNLLELYDSTVHAREDFSRRKSLLASLNEKIKEIRDLISQKKIALRRANAYIASWGLPFIEFSDSISRSDVDLDSSGKNEDWDDQVDYYLTQIRDTLSSFNDACLDASGQLDFFIKGEFDQSVIKRREQRQADFLRDQEREKQEKRSVILAKDGKECSFSIEWRQVEHPPCDPEKIRHIKTDGKIWLIVDNDDAVYRSDDRENWTRVLRASFRVRGIDIVNNVWILMGSDKTFFYSSDACDWKCFSPQKFSLEGPLGAMYKSMVEGYTRVGFLDVYDNLSNTGNIIYFNGCWLWCFDETQTYPYTEEGLIFDSTKISTYGKALIFSAETLDGPWFRWNESPKLPEGTQVKCARSVPGLNCLLIFCEYDYFYVKKKKKIGLAPFVQYYIPGKGWDSCTWPDGVQRFDSDLLITRVSDRLECFCSGKVLTSDKGYIWHVKDGGIHINVRFRLNDMDIFTTNERNQTIYMRQGAGQFRELVLEEGSWENFAANEQGAIAVYSPNRHEIFLRAGDYVYQGKA